MIYPSVDKILENWIVANRRIHGSYSVWKISAASWSTKSSFGYWTLHFIGQFYKLEKEFICRIIS